jgi:hypothetical protein
VSGRQQSLYGALTPYWCFSLKNANPAKQEQARLEVENAEDDLVQKTEVAITLMKTVLENVCYFFFTITPMLMFVQPEPIKNLNELAKAQVCSCTSGFRPPLILRS